MSRALVITGPPGAGKSSLLERLGTLLEIRAIPYAAVEADELGRGWPFITFAEWAPRLGLVCADMRSAGRELLLVVVTAETDAELAGVIDAVGADRCTVVCLTAPADVVAARVAAREPDDWPGKPWLVAHAAELAQEIPQLTGIDTVIRSDLHSPGQIAEQLLGAHLSTP